MANNTVTISGMIGDAYFASSPVVIDINGLSWPADTSMHVVEVEVKPILVPGDTNARVAAHQLFVQNLMVSSFGQDVLTSQILEWQTPPAKDDIGSMFLDLGPSYDNFGRPLRWLIAVEEDDYWNDRVAEYRQGAIEALGDCSGMSAQETRQNLYDSGYLCICSYGWGPIVGWDTSYSRRLTYLLRSYYDMAVARQNLPSYTLRSEAGNLPSIAFDLSSSLRAAWFGYAWTKELEAAATALATGVTAETLRDSIAYKLSYATEYVGRDGITRTEYSSNIESWCLMGGFTELERYSADLHEGLSWLFNTVPEPAISNAGFVATTKPTSPEFIGAKSLVVFGIVTYFETDDPTDTDPITTMQRFYPWEEYQADSFVLHDRTFVRDSRCNVDFLFINSRGALESCTARTLETEGIEVSTQQYALTGRPSFRPQRSLMAIASGGRRSWKMSSGHVAREWAEWWALEFLRAKQWWMLYDGRYLPVTVEPSNKQTSIYDRTKQDMPSVEFTVTLALEG